jgi:hypothetical protein
MAAKPAPALSAKHPISKFPREVQTPGRVGDKRTDAMTAHRQARWGVLAVLLASQAAAAQYVYPAQGQDQARQARDEADCSAWATQQTGFDPARAAVAGPVGGSATGANGTTATAAPGGASLGSGFLGGGGQALSADALGVAASALPALGGHTAGASQALGLLNQVMGQHQNAQPVHPVQQAQPIPQAAPGQANYDQARAACLSGRGYSVR